MKTRVRCIILSLLAGIACGQTVDEQDRQKSLSEAAASVAGELPKGCLVTAESLNGVVEFRGLGELPDGGREKPEDVVFEIGSITKVFNGLLLATMVIAGEVSLDDTIGELLGRGSRFADPQVAEITLLQLVTHTSGLPRLPQDLAIGGINEDPYAHYDEDRLFRYLRETSLEGEGPYESSYSNLGAGVLG